MFLLMYHLLVLAIGMDWTRLTQILVCHQMLHGLVEDGDDGNVTEIPLPNVKSQVLTKVIEFCTHHLQEPMSEIEKPLKSAIMADVVQKWYADFVNLEQVLLFELILAANYMDIKPLLDLTCATVASMIKGKTVSVLP